MDSIKYAIRILEIECKDNVLDAQGQVNKQQILNFQGLIKKLVIRNP